MSSKGADLLLALNSQVKHETPEQSIKLPQGKPGKKNPKAVNNKKLEQQEKLPQENKDQTNQEGQFGSQLHGGQTHEPPQCLVQILTKQIGSSISQGLSQVVESIIKQRQKNTYDSLTGKGKNIYVQAMYDSSKKRNESNINLIENMMLARSSKVEGELNMGKLEVIPEPAISTKQQLQFVGKLDLARLIKIKEGQLKSKIDIFHQKISNLEAAENYRGTSPQQERLQNEINRRVSQSMDANTYSLESQKTKIARQYVRYMHRERRLLQKRRKERQARYAEHQMQRQSEMQEAMQMKDLAKSQQIIERIEQRKKKRQEEEEEFQRKQKEVHSFLTQFHRKYPLFKQKEKQFNERIIKPQEQLRQQKLNEIRQNRRSLSMNQIKDHQKQYMTNLQVERVKRQQEFKLILKSRKAEDQANLYYKGQAHKRIGQMTKEGQKRKLALMEASKVKAMKMKQYSQIIHTKHKPNIDQKKKQQMMSYIQGQFMRKQKAKKVFKQVIDEATKQVKLVPVYEPLPTKDPRLEGNRFFQQARKLVKKKEDTQSQHNQPEDQLKSSRQAPGSVRLLKKKSIMEPMSKNNDIWKVRAKQLSQIAQGEIVDAKNFEYVKHNIENLDQKAAEKEDLMNKVNMSLEEHIQNKGKLDQFYLQSIKEKMKLLN